MLRYYWYKIYETIRYDIPNFFRNVYKFRKELYNHQWYDYRYTLQMLHRSLVIMEKGISEKGKEVSSTKFAKLVAMGRAISLLQNRIDDNYIERAELELGPLVMKDWKFEKLENGSYRLIDTDTPEEKKHNSEIFKRANEIEEKEWSELWEIIKGTENSRLLGDDYDGYDLRSWWD